MIRPGGIAVGIVAHEALFGVVQCHKVGTKLCFFPPVIEQNTAVSSGGFGIKPLPVNNYVYGKTPVFEAQGRPPEGSARIAVNQWQLPFIIPNQFINLCPVAHQKQGIVGGDLAAAGGGRGAETVPVLIFGNLLLIVNQSVHVILQLGAGQ